ncbi:hypothetical protein PAECIP111802_04774 [Paenibacillus allorhizosphaerae]|uniref:Uncharacterized protein n=1 Tax=Paenibacillus allorhizosphaerae TaxID=2849866 RepID=A0ABN7TPZ8_9BACL|nr:hypothetical protein PAECIP111802_04774 [Paenibacillus allorhizosphaerae]
MTKKGKPAAEKGLTPTLSIRYNEGNYIRMSSKGE